MSLSTSGSFRQKLSWDEILGCRWNKVGILGCMLNRVGILAGAGTGSGFSAEARLGSGFLTAAAAGMGLSTAALTSSMSTSRSMPMSTFRYGLPLFVRIYLLLIRNVKQSSPSPQKTATTTSTTNATSRTFKRNAINRINSARCSSDKPLGWRFWYWLRCFT